MAELMREAPNLDWVFARARIYGPGNNKCSLPPRQPPAHHSVCVSVCWMNWFGRTGLTGWTLDIDIGPKATQPVITCYWRGGGGQEEICCGSGFLRYTSDGEGGSKRAEFATVFPCIDSIKLNSIFHGGLTGPYYMALCRDVFEDANGIRRCWGFLRNIEHTHRCVRGEHIKWVCFGRIVLGSIKIHYKSITVDYDDALVYVFFGEEQATNAVGGEAFCVLRATSNTWLEV